MKEPQKIHNKWLCSIQLYLQKGTEGGFVPWVVVCWPVLQTSVDKPQLHIQLHICNWSQSAEACSTGPCRRPGFDPWVGKFPWRREWLPTLVFLPGKFHRHRILVGYSLWSYKESDITEWLTRQQQLQAEGWPGWAVRKMFEVPPHMVR